MHRGKSCRESAPASLFPVTRGIRGWIWKAVKNLRSTGCALAKGAALGQRLPCSSAESRAKTKEAFAILQLLEPGRADEPHSSRGGKGPCKHRGATDVLSACVSFSPRPSLQNHNPDLLIPLNARGLPSWEAAPAPCQAQHPRGQAQRRWGSRCRGEPGSAPAPGTATARPRSGVKHDTCIA